MTDVKAGQLYLDKDNNVFLLADSKNQRWIVNIITGVTEWLFTKDKGTIAEMEKKGYKYHMTAAEMIGGGEPPKHLEVKAAAKRYEVPLNNVMLDEIPPEYRPLKGFDDLLKGKIK